MAPPARSGPSARISVLLLTVAALAFHLPRLDRPWGPLDSNNGVFFGVFLDTWRDFGFLELRGIPLLHQRLFDPGQPEVVPYLNHPPGLYWIAAALGGEEEAFRIPGAAGAWLAAVMLCLLLRPALGAWCALAAGACLLGVPATTLHCQASFEPPTMGAGLLLWWCVLRREGSSRRGRWTAAVAAVAFLGPWLDWTFAMFCLGLLPLAASRSLREWAARLWVPALFAALGVVSILLWQQWALAGPRLHPDVRAEHAGAAALAAQTLLERPPLAEWLAAVRHLLPDVASWPVLVLGLLGLLPLARRAPRTTLALAIAATDFVVFAEHSLVHPHFFVFSTALWCAAAAALGTVRLLPPSARVVLVLLAVAGAWAGTARRAAAVDTTFFRDLGEVLTAAARPPETAPEPETEPGGERPPGRFVFHNFWPCYAAYVETPWVVVAPKVDHAFLDNVRRRHGPLAYLWFRRATDRADGPRRLVRVVGDPALEDLLAPLPRTRVPRLETRLRCETYHIDLEIEEAWLVELPRSP